MPRNDAFKITAKADGSAEIAIYDQIGFWGISAKAFRDELKALGDVSLLDIHIHSPGGEIWDGLAIYNILAAHKARKVVHVDGIAASMASVIAMVGDDIEMAENAWMMIHNPAWMVAGEPDELREAAELLEKTKTQLVGIYAKRCGLPDEEVSALMDAETWFTAEEAVAKGFADRTTESLDLAANYDLSRFRCVPNSLLTSGAKTMATESVKPEISPVTYQELKAAFPKAAAEFFTSQLDASATMEQARNAYQSQLEKAAEDARAETAAANARAEAALKAQADIQAKAQADAEAASKKPGVPPVADANTGTTQTDDDPISAWEAIVAKHTSAGIARGKAISKAVRENPEAHKAYLLAWNEKHRNQ